MQYLEQNPTPGDILPFTPTTHTTKLGTSLTRRAPPYVPLHKRQPSIMKIVDFFARFGTIRVCGSPMFSSDPASQKEESMKCINAQLPASTKTKYNGHETPYSPQPRQDPTPHQARRLQTKLSNIVTITTD